MLKHFGPVAVAALASLAAAQGVVSLHDWMRAPPPAQAASVEAAPFAPRPQPADAAVVKGPDGHFWAEASVDGRRVRFLVDTGATAVSLTLADARRLGLDPDRLAFTQDVQTAGGMAHAATVELPYVSVAGARIEKVKALILDRGLETSLLGMTYLGRLSRFEASRDSLILRP
jgi:aspartyl protease family protein